MVQTSHQHYSMQGHVIILEGLGPHHPPHMSVLVMLGLEDVVLQL